MTAQTMTVQEWEAEGIRRFGEDRLKWRFVCPSCKVVSSVQDWKDAGAPEIAVAFSCVGRWKDGVDENTFRGNGQRCHYAGGGLFRLNPVKVVFPGGGIRETFAFADGCPGCPACPHIPEVEAGQVLPRNPIKIEPTLEEIEREVIDRNGH